jgi:hypothetical protein
MFKERVAEILGVVGEIAWRGFGIFLFVIGASAGSGAIFTGDPLIGIVIAWSTLMLGVVAAVGYAIAVTGKASKATVAKAAQDAVQKFEEGKK